jgi:hypothetical protein
MTATLVAVDELGGGAVVADGEDLYLLSIDAGWEPKLIEDLRDLFLWVSQASPRWMSEEYEDVAAARFDVRQVFAKRFPFDRQGLDKVLSLAPIEVTVGLEFVESKPITWSSWAASIKELVKPRVNRKAIEEATSNVLLDLLARNVEPFDLGEMQVSGQLVELVNTSVQSWLERSSGALEIVDETIRGYNKLPREEWPIRLIGPDTSVLLAKAISSLSELQFLSLLASRLGIDHHRLAFALEIPSDMTRKMRARSRKVLLRRLDELRDEGLLR